MKKLKKISIGILLLLMIGMLASVYQASGYSRNYSRYYPGWVYRPLPYGDKATDIAVGYRGGVYCTDDDPRSRGLWSWNEAGNRWDWVRGPRHFVRISVDNDRNPWGISNYNEIWQQKNGRWYILTKNGLPSGSLIDIATGFQTANLQLYVVASNNYAYYYSGGQWKRIVNVKVTRVAIEGGNGGSIAINGISRRTYTGFFGSEWFETYPRGYGADDVAAKSQMQYVIGYYGVSYLGTAAYYLNDMAGRWESICRLYGARGYIFSNNIDVGGLDQNDPVQRVWLTNRQGEVYYKAIQVPN